MSNLWKTYYYCFPKCLGEFAVLYKKNFASWLDFLGNISCCILRWLIFVTYLAIHCLKFPVRPCHLWGQQSQPLHSPLTRCSVSPQALLRGVFALHFSQHRSKFPFGCSLVLVFHFCSCHSHVFVILSLDLIYYSFSLEKDINPPFNRYLAHGFFSLYLPQTGIFICFQPSLVECGDHLIMITFSFFIIILQTLGYLVVNSSILLLCRWTVICQEILVVLLFPHFPHPWMFAVWCLVKWKVGYLSIFENCTVFHHLCQLVGLLNTVTIIETSHIFYIKPLFY